MFTHFIRSISCGLIKGAHMKRAAGSIILIAAVVCMGAGNSDAAGKKKKSVFEKTKKPEVVVEVNTAEDVKRKMRDALKAQEWILYLSSSKGQEAKPQVDIVTFTDTAVNSKNLFSKGYAESSYSLDIGSPEAAVWEASQTNAQGDLVCWRGELKGKMMQGVLSMLRKDGSIEDFYFSNAAPEEKL